MKIAAATVTINEAIGAIGTGDTAALPAVIFLRPVSAASGCQTVRLASSPRRQAAGKLVISPVVMGDG